MYTLYTAGDGGYPHVVSEHDTADAAIEAGTRLAEQYPSSELWVLNPTNTDVVWEC